MIDGSTQNFEGKGGPGLGTTLQHTAAHCLKLQHTAAHCNTLQHTATHCNALQHIGTHCTTGRVEGHWRCKSCDCIFYGVASLSLMEKIIGLICRT